MQRPQGSGGGPGLGLKITRAVGGVRRRLGRSAGRGGAPERPCKHADVGIDGVPICAAVCTTDAALYKWLAAEYCRVWRTIALQRIDLSGCCVREVISSGTRMALKILVSAVRFRPRPPHTTPNHSVGRFCFCTATLHGTTQWLRVLILQRCTGPLRDSGPCFFRGTVVLSLGASTCRHGRGGTEARHSPMPQRSRAAGSSTQGDTSDYMYVHVS